MKTPRKISQYLPDMTKPAAFSMPIKVLKAGVNENTAMPAITMAVRFNKRLSIINCFTKPAFAAPNTFLTPTSLARSTERAVERFI